MSTISLGLNQIGKGFVPLIEGDLLKTSDQYFSYSTESWALGASFTSDLKANPGKVAYRRPVSLRARLSLVPSLIGKVWTYRIKTLWSKPQWK